MRSGLWLNVHANPAPDANAGTVATVERRIADLRAGMDKQDSLRIFTLQGRERLAVMGQLDTLERFVLPGLLERAAANNLT